MRRSNEATTLAKLRLAIGFRQSELGALFGVSPHIIQNIELGKTHLPGDLADDASQLTGVDLEWLLDGDVSKPIINEDGQPFTRDDFYRRQMQIRQGRNVPESIAPRVEADLCMNLQKLIAITEAALRDKKYDVVSYKIKRALWKLCVETNGFDFVIPPQKGEPLSPWPDLGRVVAYWKSRHDCKAEFESFLGRPLQSNPSLDVTASKPAANQAKRKPARR